MADTFSVSAALSRHACALGRSPGLGLILHALETALWGGMLIFILAFDAGGLPGEIALPGLLLAGALAQAVIAAGWYRLLGEGKRHAGLPLALSGVELKLFALILALGAVLAAGAAGLAVLADIAGLPGLAAAAILLSFCVFATRVVAVPALLVRTGAFRWGEALRKGGAFWGRLIACGAIWTLAGALVLAGWYAAFFRIIWAGGGDMAGIGLMLLGAVLVSLLAGWARGMAVVAAEAVRAGSPTPP